MTFPKVWRPAILLNALSLVGGPHQTGSTTCPVKWPPSPCCHNVYSNRQGFCTLTPSAEWLCLLFSPDMNPKVKVHFSLEEVKKKKVLKKKTKENTALSLS